MCAGGGVRPGLHPRQFVAPVPGEDQDAPHAGEGVRHPGIAQVIADDDRVPEVQGKLAGGPQDHPRSGLAPVAVAAVRGWSVLGMVRAVVYPVQAHAVLGQERRQALVDPADVRLGE